jgi:pullulanase/glycogen debranching enzyme
MWKRSAITVKSVKGRFIVQPSDIRELALHEITIDSLNPDQGIYKTPTFLDAMKEIERCKELGINAIYLMGVFERDND